MRLRTLLLLAAIALVAFWGVQALILRPLPGYILVVTSLGLPLALVLWVFWRLQKKSRSTGAPDDPSRTRL